MFCISGSALSVCAIVAIYVDISKCLSLGFGNGENSCWESFLVVPSRTMVTSINLFFVFLESNVTLEAFVYIDFDFSIRIAIWNKT